MITRSNLKEVISQLSIKDVKRVKSTSKEYCVIYLHVFNTGSITTITLTNNYWRYNHVGNDGNCILETKEVLNLLP